MNYLKYTLHDQKVVTISLVFLHISYGVIKRLPDEKKLNLLYILENNYSILFNDMYHKMWTFVLENES